MNYDLTVDNYTPEELVDIFELPLEYDTIDINKKEIELRNNILNNADIPSLKRDNIITFIAKAKQILCDHLASSIVPQTPITGPQMPSTQPMDIINSAMVQHRKDASYTATFPGEYFPGEVNPIKKRVVNQILNIDTRFRDNYYSTASTNFKLALPTTFKRVLSMELTAIELPATFYNISKQYGNNFFTVSVYSSVPDSGTIPKQAVIEIPSGKYDYAGLISAINAGLMNAGDVRFNYIRFAVNIDSSGTGSGQMAVGLMPDEVDENGTYLVNVPADLVFDLDFKSTLQDNPDATPLPLKLGWILGFRNGLYVGNSSYVSEGILDVSGMRYAYLVIDDYAGNVNDSFICALNGSMLRKGILGRISMHGSAFSIVSDNAQAIVSPPRCYHGPVDISGFQVQLIDEYGRVIDLNNMDFSFCLKIETAYDI